MGFEEIYEKKPKIKVNMTGEEYLAYLKHREEEKKKKRLTKKQREGIIILILCVLGMFLVLYLLHDLTYTPIETKGFFSN